MRMAVEAWHPDYGGGVDVGEPEEASVEQVDSGCETSNWQPIAARSTAYDDGEVGFVDGTRRIDARVFLMEDGNAPVPGVAGSIGVGAVVCRGSAMNGSEGRAAAFARLDVTRYLAVGGGLSAGLSAGPGLEYKSFPCPGYSIELLVDAVHNNMRAAEASLAQELADGERLVFVDGPLAVMRADPQKVVGFIKSHHKRYLPPEKEEVLGALGCGERTPLFAFGEPRPRYSWYLRLCPLDAASHGWHGLARCEAPASLPVKDVVALADASAGLLPAFASKPHWDARAPQNLVPIAGLEKRLRHLLGERELVYRKIRSGVSRMNEEGVVGG